MATSGCWQYQDLNELAVVSAIGIDKIEDDYLVSAQIINVKKLTKDSSTSGEEAPVTVYEAKAKTIGQALNKMALQLPKELYLSHIDVVVVGEETAKIGLREYIDFLLRDREARKVYPFIVAKGSKAVEVLKVLTPIETLPSTSLAAVLENAHKINGVITNRTFDNILMCLYTKGRYPTVPAVEIIKQTKEGEQTDNISSSSPKTKIQITGPAVFLEDKLVGYFTNKQGLGYNLIRERVIGAIVSFPCDDTGNYGSVKLDTPKVEKSFTFKDGEPVFKIKVDVTATITDYNCKLNLRKSKNIEKVETMVEKEIKKILNAVIKVSQEKYKADVLGFGELLYRNQYSYWNKVEKDWDKIFPNVKYDLEANTLINNTGSITIPAREGGTNGNN